MVIEYWNLRFICILALGICDFRHDTPRQSHLFLTWPKGPGFSGQNKPIRVLIVEDSEDDVLLLVRQLKKGGYNPTYNQVDTAEAMMKAFEKQTWDVILCDNSMPGFSAFDALDLYKEKRLDLPFIIVSGAIVYENAVALIETGAHDYILKNNLAELTPAINRALRKTKNRQ